MNHSVASDPETFLVGTNGHEPMRTLDKRTNQCTKWPKDKVTWGEITWPTRKQDYDQYRNKRQESINI